MTGVSKIIELEKIVPSTTNPRVKMNGERFKELVKSVSDKGVLQPILVRPVKDENDRYEIVCGYRRFMACKECGRLDIPAILSALSDKEVLEIQVIENLQREDVHPLDEAECYARLIAQYGYGGAEEIAAKIGKSRGYVYQRIKLCDLTDKVKKIFEEDKISLTAALAIAKLPQDMQDKAAEDIGGFAKSWDRPMSARQIREYLKEEVMLALDEAPFDPDDAGLVEGVGSCHECPKMSGFNIELFPELCDENMCSDAQCFKNKRLADYNKKTAPYAELGYRIVPAEAFIDDAFGGIDGERWHYERFDSKYWKCPEEGVTLGDLLSKYVPFEKVFVGVNEKGEIVFAVHEDTAKEYLAQHYEWAKERKDEDDEEDEDPRDGFRRQAYENVQRTLVPAVGQKIEKFGKLGDEFLRALILKGCDDGYFDGVVEDYLKAHPDIKTNNDDDDQGEIVRAIINVMSTDELLAFYAELFLFSLAHWSEREFFAQAVSTYGVNLSEEIEAEIDRLIEADKGDQEGADEQEN